MEPNSFENQNVAVETKSAPVGPIVGTIIIIAVLAFGALYFWGDRLNNNAGEMPYALDTEYAVLPETEGWMPAASNSDEADAIESELQSFDVNSFENQLNSDLEGVNAGL